MGSNPILSARYLLSDCFIDTSPRGGAVKPRMFHRSRVRTQAVKEPEMATFPVNFSRRIFKIAHQPVAVFQDRIDFVLAALAPAGRQTGTHEGDTHWAEFISRRFEPRIVAGEALRLFGQISQRKA